MTKIKRECDVAAHKGAQRVATGGAGLLFVYWYVVYRLTFETDLGWDTMEPVTVSGHSILQPVPFLRCTSTSLAYRLSFVATFGSYIIIARYPTVQR